MSTELISTISGIRGIVGEALVPETAVQAGKAFGLYIKGGSVVVGGDSRTSHQMLKSALISGLISSGCKIIDIGIAPTPTIELAIIGIGAAGGVAITASHNPIEWNGLKFFNHKGEFLTSDQYERFSALLGRKTLPSRAWNGLGSVRSDQSWIDRHVREIRRLDLINPDALRIRKFKVVIDAVNGAGSLAGPLLLEKFNCRVAALNCNLDGHFPHAPEPLPANLKMLCAEVLKQRADIGFALDPDADRLAIVSEKGKPIGEEYTLALVADFVLARQPGPMVINLSSSNLNRDVCARYGCHLHYSKVGEANVVEVMHQKKAVIGGEGNGGIILPALHYGRDALVGMALALQYMVESRKSISRLADDLGKYVIIKSKGNIRGDFDVRLGRLQKELSAQKISAVDGVRVDFDYGWVHIRQSNTEPIYRVIAEGRTRKQAEDLIRFINEKL